MYCTSPSVIWCCVAPLRKRSDGYVHARDHAHGSEAAPVFSSVFVALAVSLEAGDACWTHSSTLPAPFGLTNGAEQGALEDGPLGERGA